MVRKFMIYASVFLSIFFTLSRLTLSRRSSEYILPIMLLLSTALVFTWVKINAAPIAYDAIDAIDAMIRIRADARVIHAPVDEARIMYDIYGLGRDPIHNIVRNHTVTDVHDHQIQETLKESINKLHTWYDTLDYEQLISKDDTMSQIKEYLFGEYQEKFSKKEMIYSTIRSIEKVNGKLNDVKMSEMDILRMVWQRINSPINEKNHVQLRDNLFDLLADSSIRVDSPYCLVGRITRIVQSLQSYDMENIIDIRSTRIISDEMQSKIPVLINAYFDNPEHADLKEAYDNGDDAIAENLKEYVHAELINDYPTSRGDALNNIITELTDTLT